MTDTNEFLLKNIAREELKEISSPESACEIFTATETGLYSIFITKSGQILPGKDRTG